MTLLSWMLYAMLVPVLLAGGAWLLEHALLAAGRPVRWVWAAAIVVGTGIPLAALAGLAGSGDVPGEVAILRSPQTEAVGTPIVAASDGREARALRPLGAATASLSHGLQRILDAGSRTGASIPSERLVATFWGGGALLLFLISATASLRLQARARRWPSARLEGVLVRIAPTLGPAVIGVVRPLIVVPRRAMALRPAQRRSILLHEREHVLARDTAVLTGTAVLVMVCFWSPGLWWMLRRLRGAVEMDCDRRVLARGVPPAEYGSLLVEVGMWKGGFPLPVAALAEPANLLERRLRQMKTADARHPFLAAGGAAVAAALLLAVACETDAPTSAAVPDEEPGAVEGLRSIEALPTVPPQGIGEILMIGPWAVGEISAADLLGRVGELTVPGELPTIDGSSVTRLEFGASEDPPLLVVDGVMLQSQSLTLALDPEAIESIEVVRGAAARELYGSRGANGVVLITTRNDEG